MGSSPAWSPEPLPALVLLFLGKTDYMARLGLAPINLHPVYVVFPIIMALSTIASVGVCLLTRPEKDEVLKSFYRTVRPWGFWRPIYEKCRAEDPTIQPNRDFWRDWFNIVVGLVWEMSMVALPIFLVHPAAAQDVDLPDRLRGHVRDPEVHLVRQAGAGRRAGPRIAKTPGLAPDSATP